TSLIYPEDVEGRRRELVFRYNRAGRVNQAVLDGISFAEHIAYNARGQPTLVAYGNSTMTRYVHHPQSFRLARIRTDPYQNSGPHDFRVIASAPPALQDCAYSYDLAGNLIGVRDQAAGSGVPTNPDGLSRDFEYDALYRLVAASGRECDPMGSDVPWDSGV